MAVITLKNVSKHYKDTIAVKDVSFEIEKGSIVAILGPNGAGKTTTLSMMLGLQHPTKGLITINGKNPRSKAVRGEIGAMLQDVNVIDGLKVKEIINLFRRYYPSPLSTETLLQVSGLEKDSEKYATSLSGGQRRRLGFALAMAGDPSIIFLDEPTVGMDITSRKRFWDTMKAFASTGKTIILSTHYLEEADQLADRIILLREGSMVADGTPSQIKSSVHGKRISFIPLNLKSKEQLMLIPGVDDIQYVGRKVTLYTDQTDEVLVQLVKNNILFKDLETHHSGLDEAFQSLVEAQ